MVGGLDANRLVVEREAVEEAASVLQRLRVLEVDKAVALGRPIHVANHRDVGHRAGLEAELKEEVIAHARVEVANVKR
jgi:hypothetical protein